MNAVFTYCSDYFRRQPYFPALLRAAPAGLIGAGWKSRQMRHIIPDRDSAGERAGPEQLESVA
jgi:hypothetical protein